MNNILRGAAIRVLFMRTASLTHRAPTPSGLPKVNMPGKIQAYNQEPLLITCSAQSEIPFRLQLSRGGKKLGKEQLLR